MTATMKLFTEKEVKEAVEHSAAGGQALHVWRPGSWPWDAPECFRKAKLWGHLLDLDERRLVSTARRLGVRRVVVDRKGERGQHVDLCGAPLHRAIDEAKVGLPGDEDEKR